MRKNSSQQKSFRQEPARTVGTVSPFRYPGGKTWLLPTIRAWLRDSVDLLVEPFAGGGSVSVMAVSERLARRCHMIERDPDVASVWAVMLNGKAQWLCGKIEMFKFTAKQVRRELDRTIKSEHDRAWITLLRNRVSHGGLLAPGAGLLRRGEADRGLRSRWYPKTISNRIRAIHSLRSRIDLSNGDGLTFLHSYASAKIRLKTAFFLDPPYTRVGARLYKYGVVDHERLFVIGASLPGRVLMTYDDSPQVRRFARKYGFKFRRVQMKSRQHVNKKELLISRDFSWLRRVRKTRAVG